MPNCMEQVYSEEYYDFFDSVRGGGRGSVHARMRASRRITTFFLPARGTAAAFYRELYLHGDTKCYALLDTTALDASESPGCRISRCLR